MAPPARPHERSAASTAMTALGLGAWLVGCVAGYVMLLDYGSAPGAPADAPDSWPAAAWDQAADEPTLVFIAHPHCACTRASLAELDRLMTRLVGSVDAHVLFVQPEGTDADWVESDLWAAAARIPDTRLVVDAGGELADAFGAYTSGQTLLYAADGTRQFAGGITAARGHEGDSVGRQQILALVDDQSAAPSDSDVFGCALQDDLASGGRQLSALERFEFSASSKDVP